MMTEIGTDQLSYSAAVHRNTTEDREGIKAHRPGRSPSFSCNDKPLHAHVLPDGRLFANCSILLIAVPELAPLAFSP